MPPPANPFDRGPTEAREYDAWYDTPLGRATLAAEQRCVATLLDGAPHPWLDLGTGSGRFGGPLGADLGLDPAADLLRIARRLPSVVRGVAEALPIRDASLGAVLTVAVLEFLPAPALALREVARTLRPGGRLVVGFLPREGAWARAYARQGADPGSLFHGARFLTTEELCSLAAAAGLAPTGLRATLFEPSGTTPSLRIEDHPHPDAGFIALALLKPRAERSSERQRPERVQPTNEGEKGNPARATTPPRSASTPSAATTSLPPSTSSSASSRPTTSASRWAP